MDFCNFAVENGVSDDSPESLIFGTMQGTDLKNKVLGFVWQHLLLLVSLFFMTFGVALCVRSGLGSGVISAIPMVMSLAGDDGLAPGLSIGEYTYIMNGVFVALQVLIMRRAFEPVQLFQLLVGFFFGYMLDVNMAVTSLIDYDSVTAQVAAQLAGCTVLGAAIAFEIRCGSVTMPGEGIQVAVSKVTGKPFPTVKICIDTLLVVIATIIGFIYFGRWMWNVVGVGTLFAMFYVGCVVRFVSKRIGWFDRLLAYRPGFRRYIYGLARFIYPRRW